MKLGEIQQDWTAALADLARIEIEMNTVRDEIDRLVSHRHNAKDH